MYNNGCKFKILNNHIELEKFKKENRVDVYAILPHCSKIVIFFDYVEVMNSFIIQYFDINIKSRNALELMKYMQDRWQWSDYITFEDQNNEKTLVTIHTGGWSGHEDMIEALMENSMFWMLYWQSSHRGGLYTFEI